MALTLEQALHLAEDAFDAFEFEDMLAYSNQALAQSPGSFEALELKANALAELGEWAGADEAFEVLLTREPANAALLLAAADVKVRLPGDDRERIEAGLELIDRAWPVASQDEALFIEAELLRGVALNQLGECEDALGSFTQVLEVDPENAEAQLEKGIALFELGRFDEAKKDFTVIARDFPQEPWSFHYLGLIAERSSGASAQLFEQARSLAPDDFPPPVHLGPEAFDAALKEAIEALPAHAKPHLENVIITVEPLPSLAEIREGLSPSILGVFHGTPVNERNPLEAAHHQTARITLYQNNLERFARTRAELLEEIRITVLHEVGHLLGLDEDDLYERGLD
jgi:predicted Zn-dependent protease with MMP-like domain/Flp pilus assembly protein TadD